LEIWIWLAALIAGLLILVIALLVVAIRVATIAKKLKPFIDQVASFQKGLSQYPDAIRLISNMANSKDSQAQKGQRPKG
jgi:uncharacterized protein YoxC